MSRKPLSEMNPFMTFPCWPGAVDSVFTIRVVKREAGGVIDRAYEVEDRGFDPFLYTMLQGVLIGHIGDPAFDEGLSCTVVNGNWEVRANLYEPDRIIGYCADVIRTVTLRGRPIDNDFLFSQTRA